MLVAAWAGAPEGGRVGRNGQGTESQHDLISACVTLDMAVTSQNVHFLT